MICQLLAAGLAALIVAFFGLLCIVEAGRQFRLHGFSIRRLRNE